MDLGSKKTRALPALPQRGQKPLPTMRQTAAGDVTAGRHKKKAKRDEAEDQDVQMSRPDQWRESLPSESTREPPTEAPNRRRRKKKKTTTMDLDNDQADLVDEDAANQTTDGEGVAKKSRKKKRSKVTESQLPSDLDVEDDDVITDTPPSVPQPLALGQGQSQPSARVFVEKNKRFQPTDVSDWRKTSVLMDNMADLQHVPPPVWTTRDVSVRVHEGFRVLGLYCHGFLAGFAVWNVVVVHVLAGPQRGALANLLQQYHGLAPPAQCLLYLLLALSAVAAFDRLNVAEASAALRELVALDGIAMASLLYFSALVLSLSQQMTSDRIHLYAATNASLWTPGSEQQVLNPWITINLVVALLVGVAWIFTVVRPEKDFTKGYLMTMEVDPPKPGDKLQTEA